MYTYATGRDLGNGTLQTSVSLLMTYWLTLNPFASMESVINTTFALLPCFVAIV
jgi:hypothetical protein